jgi:predicted NUDIX family NTP pyrophosphohydrolase
MPKLSAGVLIFRLINIYPEILLVHPGGPFWAKKDLGVWSIPKGELTESETPEAAARRELQEETGIIAAGKLIELKPVKQKNNKIVLAWALEQDFDPSDLISNPFELEWPPGTGRIRQFPEVDKAAWFNLDKAKEKILAGQIPFIEELVKLL